jgi:hypothetical protein
MIEIHKTNGARIIEGSIQVEGLIMLPHEASREWIPVREKQIEWKQRLFQNSDWY